MNDFDYNTKFTKKELKKAKEKYKDIARKVNITKMEHLFDVKRGAREILEELEIDVIKLENEVKAENMNIIEKQSYEVIARIFKKYTGKTIDYNYDNIDTLFFELRFEMNQEDVDLVINNMELISRYQED